MLVVVTGLLLILLLAVGVVLVVALPRLRAGAPVLTPQGERAVRQAAPAAVARRIGAPRPVPADSGPVPVVAVVPTAPVAPAGGGVPLHGAARHAR